MPGAFAEVRSTTAQDPAYRPTRFGGPASVLPSLVSAIIDNMPKPPTGALFVHWFHLFCIAVQERDKANEIQAANPNAWPTEALSAILFSAMSAEAFINELAEAAARDTHEVRTTGMPGVDVLRDLATTLDEIEAAQGTTALKYHMARKVLGGQTFPTGKAPFQDFNALVRLRNDLVHPKHRDRTREGRYIEPATSVVRDLQGRGLTSTKGRNPGDPGGGISWLNEIECGRTATWACETAREIITAILTLLPQGPHLFAINLFRDRLANLPTLGGLATQDEATNTPA